jgi:hypothetical protein
VNRDLIDNYQTTLDTPLQQGNPITKLARAATFFIDGDEAQPHCICEEIELKSLIEEDGLASHAARSPSPSGRGSG